MEKAQGWREAIVVTAMITSAAIGIQAIPSSAAGKSSTKHTAKHSTASDSGAGTHHGEYLPDQGATGASSTNPDKPYNKTSTGRELTGPGTHPGEYDAAKVAPPPQGLNGTSGGPNGANGAARDSIDSWDGSRGGRGDSTRVRGSGPTRPRDGDIPPPSVPETPRGMPGNGNSTLPGNGSGGSRPGSPTR